MYKPFEHPGHIVSVIETADPLLFFGTTEDGRCLMVIAGSYEYAAINMDYRAYKGEGFFNSRVYAENSFVRQNKTALSQAA